MSARDLFLAKLDLGLVLDELILFCVGTHHLDALVVHLDSIFRGVAKHFSQVKVLLTILFRIQLD